MEPEGAREDSFRISSASAASSFCCHSEQAETKACSEAVGSCGEKGVGQWQLGARTSPPHVTSAPQSPVPLKAALNPRCPALPIHQAWPLSALWTQLFSQDLWLQERRVKGGIGLEDQS